jgi:hypothetical protein
VRFRIERGCQELPAKKNFDTKNFFSFLKESGIFQNIFVNLACKTKIS